MPNLSDAGQAILSHVDPLLLQLSTAYYEGNASDIESSLDQIHADACSSSIRQSELGTADCINVIFSILNELLDKPYSVPRVELKDTGLKCSSSTAINFDAVNIANQQESLVEKSFWVLVRLCRREMSKMTANDANMKLLENCQQSFEIITSICTQYIKYPRIVLPVCWLIMVLASDSSERQFKLTSVNGTSLVVNILAEHKNDVKIAEMACRAARNLAAGDPDVVAKFVEDKICEGLVGIIRAQLRQSPYLKPAVKYEDNDLQVSISTGTMSSSVPDSVSLLGLSIEDHPIQYATDPVDETVCEAALWAIVNLSCEENVSTILGSVGGIEAVVDVAMISCSSDVALAAISAIRNISSVGTLNFSLLAKTKVCEILLLNLKTFSSSIELVETGLWALTNLACDSVLASRLGSLGAAKVVVDAYYRCGTPKQWMDNFSNILASIRTDNIPLSTHPCSIVPMHPQEGKPAGPISEVCLWAILNLAASSVENEDRLGEAGCCELVGQIVEIYRLREGMVELALNALIHLCYHSEANKCRVGSQPDLKNKSEGAGPVCLPILKCILDASGRYTDNESIAENVFKFCLLSLNGVDEDRIAHNKQQLLHFDVPSFASEAMSSCSEHTEVVRLGCGLLLVLRFDDLVYKESLSRAGQLDGAGKASPQGAFSEVAAAWGFRDCRSEEQMRMPPISRSTAELPCSLKLP